MGYADNLSSRSTLQAVVTETLLSSAHIRPNKKFLKGYKPASRSAVMEAADGIIRPHKNRLTAFRTGIYASHHGAQNTMSSGQSPRKSAAIFTPIGFVPTGGSAANKRPVRGICPPSRHGFELLPTCLKSRPEVSSRSETMHQPSHARTGQDTTTLIQQITRDAIKRAAVARTYADALDITGAALLAVAALAKMGVQHG